MSMRRFSLIAMAICLLAVVMACSKTEEGGANSAETEPKEETLPQQEQVVQIDTTPVELTFYAEITPPANDEQLMEDFGKYVARKYPHITFKNNIYYPNVNVRVDGLVATGAKFDLAKAAVPLMYNFIDVQVGSDISDLIKKYNVDLSALDQSTLQLMRNATGGHLIGLPYQNNSMIMFYNKAIFNRFGVPFPTDDMLWDEVIDLARRVTRLDGGVQYKGFDSQQWWDIMMRANQLGVEPINLTTNKVTFSDPKWKQLFDQFAAFYKIPGNTIGGNITSQFIKDQSLAMITAYPNFSLQFVPELDWDMVSAPNLPGLPGVGFQPIPSVLALAKDSPHRDAAFLVAMTMASKEVQLERARKYGLMSILNDAQIREEIGADMPALAGKNRKAMQPLKVAAPITFSPYLSDATGGLRTAFHNVVEKGEDVNTALRVAEEAANKAIAEKIAAKGN